MAVSIQLALAADFGTTPDCQWSVLEAKWGLVPDMVGTIPLLEQLPLDVAKRLAMTGETFSGTRAAEWGVASGVADDPSVLAEGRSRKSWSGRRIRSPHRRNS